MRPDMYLNRADKNGNFRFTKYTTDDEELLYLHTQTYKPVFEWFENEVVKGRKKFGGNTIVTQEDLMRLCLDLDETLGNHSLGDSPTGKEIPHYESSQHYESLRYVRLAIHNILDTFDFGNYTVVYNRGKGNR